MFRSAARLLALIFCAVPSAAALGQHRVDCILSLSPGLNVAPNSPQTIQTAFFVNAGDTTPTPARVFPSTLGTVSPNFTDTPGYDCLPSTFPVGSNNGFNIRKALRRWNGGGFTILSGPSVEHIQVTYGPFGPVQSPDCDVFTPGFTVVVPSSGEWHRHLEYYLTDPAATGIYLLELEIFSDNVSPPIAKTKPFWFVFQQLNQNDFTTSPAALQAEQDAAIAWANSHLVPRLCPADFNASGAISVQDVFDFLTSWFAASPDADFNGSCTDTVQDIFSFLTAWFAGCPA